MLTHARAIWEKRKRTCRAQKRAKEALEKIEAELLKLPPRCADIHCIENLFNQIKCHLDEEAVTQNITKESFEQFSARVLRAFDNFPIKDIDKLILSTTRRIEAVLAFKGHKTKYWLECLDTAVHTIYYIFHDLRSFYSTSRATLFHFKKLWWL